MHEDQISNCVARVPIFSKLRPEQQEAVGAFAHHVLLDAGEHLHNAGDRVGQLFVVHTGKVKVVRISETGREHVARLVGPGDVVGEQGFLTGERPNYQVEAIEPTEMCVFDHAELGRLVSAHPRIAVEMLRAVTERLDTAERRLALAGADVVARVSDYLLTQPSARGVVQLPAAKRDIAAYLSTTPESLSRALTRLQTLGLIEVRGSEVTLLDPAALEDLAGH